MNPPEWDQKIFSLAQTVQLINRKQADKVAVIIEPRNLSVLHDILKWMTYLLAPAGWTFIAYVGTTSSRDINAFVRRHRLQDVIQIRHLDTDNLTFPQYNALLTSLSFWESMPFENILIFQTDSVLLTNKLEPYLEYDYVGAPWSKETSWLPKPVNTTGNGGLSLRRKSAMLRVLANVPYNDHNEDVFFSIDSSKYLNICPAPKAVIFSVETMFYKTPCGYHKPWRYMTKQQMKTIYDHMDSVINRNGFSE